MFRIVKLKYIIAPKLNLLKLNSKTKIMLSEVVSIQFWSRGFQHSIMQNLDNIIQTKYMKVEFAPNGIHLQNVDRGSITVW